MPPPFDAGIESVLVEDLPLISALIEQVVRLSIDAGAVRFEFAL
jgi:hypothetical protein